MTVKEKIQQEKLENILNPKKSNTDGKITIRFRKNLSRNYEEALKIAKQHPSFMEEGEGDFYTVYVSYQIQEVEELHTLFNLVRDFPTTKLFLNNKSIPYIHDLWLFLFWFYRIRPFSSTHA